MLTDAHGRRQENNTYVSVLVNYSYLADGTKVSALRSDGSGLSYHEFRSESIALENLQQMLNSDVGEYDLLSKLINLIFNYDW